MIGNSTTSIDLEKADPGKERDRLSRLTFADGHDEITSEIAMLVLKTLAGLFVIGLVAFPLSRLQPFTPISYDDLFDADSTQFHIELLRMTLLVSMFWMHNCSIIFTHLVIPNIINYLARHGVHLFLPVGKSFEYISACSHHLTRLITSILIWVFTFKLFPYYPTPPIVNVPWTVQPWHYYIEHLTLLYVLFCSYFLIEKSALHVIKYNYHKVAYKERAYKCILGIWAIKTLLEAYNGNGVLRRKKRFLYKADDMLWCFLKGNLINSGIDITPEVLGRQLFTMLVKENNHYLTPQDFSPHFAKADCERVFALMDVGSSGDITEPELCRAVFLILRERGDLVRALDGHQSLARKLDKLLMLFVYIFTLITFFPLFDYNPQRALIPLGVSLTPTIVACTVIFGDTIKSFFASLFFIFANHPFDMDDRIYMDGETYFIHEVNLWSTTFRQYGGLLLYLPNHLVAGKSFCNVKRTGRQAQRFELTVWSGTPSDKLELLRQTLLTHITTGGSRDFSALIACTWELRDTNDLVLVLLLRHRLNFQDFIPRSERQNRFLEFVQQVVKEQLGMEYYPPVRTIEMLDPLDDKDVVIGSGANKDEVQAK